MAQQRQALGRPEDTTAETLVEEHRAHLHPLDRIVGALREWFELGPALRGAYLYRWDLGESLRASEEDQIARGLLPAVGARLRALRQA